MTVVTPEQHAAWKLITSHLAPENAAIIAPLLPPDLTDPQPVLPTEPGLYASHTDPDAAWKLHKDGEWWPPYQDYAVDIAEVHAAAPFTRLVPERPRVTRDEVARASFDALGAGKPGGVAFNDALHAALDKSTDRD